MHTPKDRTDDPSPKKGDKPDQKVDPAKNTANPPCHYVEPIAGGAELTGKFGPAIEVGNFAAGASIKKTLGDDAGTEVVFGFKGMLSIQRTTDSVWGSGSPYNAKVSVTIFGFNKDLSTPFFSRSGWTFNPSKEFKVGIQGLAGGEIGWSSEKFKQTINANRACGY